MAGAAPLKAPPSLKVDVKSKAVALNINYRFDIADIAALDGAEAATGHQSHRDVDVWMLQCPPIWFSLLDVSASSSATQDR